MRKSIHQHRVLFGLGVSAAALFAANPAAAQCVDEGAIWNCSGQNETGQTVEQDGVEVRTKPGFSVETEDDSALYLRGLGYQGYADQSSSSLTGKIYGLQVFGAGDRPIVDGGNGIVDIETNGAISGGTYGVHVLNDGSGGTRVKTTGDVSGGEKTGIYIQNISAASGDLTLEAGQVSGGETGMEVRNGGVGKTKITAPGDVIGGSGYGIYAANGSRATDLEIVAGNVHTDGIDGIFAQNSGVGSTGIRATGQVTGGTDGSGVDASNGETAANLVIDVASATGGDHGIVASNAGRGITNIFATGDVNGSDRDGIHATVAANAAVDSTPGNLSIVATNVTGGENGIFVENLGDGSTGIQTTGSVVGEGRDGIFVHNGENTRGLGVDAASVTGGGAGIFAENDGKGETRIAANGDISGTEFHGIYARNGENAAKLGITVSQANVTGGLDGIRADNEGTADTSIRTSGHVEGRDGNGIQAINRANATDLIIDANSVKGSGDGISAWNQGQGNTGITTRGEVTGAGGIGIYATNNASAKNLTVETVDGAKVTGLADGIYVENAGAGLTRVKASGDVSGTDSFGIFVRHNGADLAIEAAGVKGGVDGIHAENMGVGGDTRIAAAGHVEGAGGSGIYALNIQDTGSLRIEATSVTGSEYGINVENAGNDLTSIKTSGDIIGTTLDGIGALNDANTGDLMIETAVVTGARHGIQAQNQGTGQTSIKALQTVTGTNGAGMLARNGATATSLTIEAAAVTGGEYGVYADNGGTGLTSVKASDDVNGALGLGIFARNAETASDLMVEAINVSGGETGIGVSNQGSGQTSVKATGTAAGTTSAGIIAQNGATATDLTIDAARAVGGVVGLNVDNQGTGLTRIKAEGDVIGGSFGIAAANGATAKDLIVETANAAGGTYGIFTQNLGIGRTDITTNGIVEGGNAAVVATSSAGQAIGIVNSGNGVLRNRSGSSADLAIGAIGGPVALTNNGAILGAAVLGDAADSFANAGTWNSIGGPNDFGGGADRLTNAAAGTLTGALVAGIAETTRYDNLEELANDGLISLADGGVGDRFETSGTATFGGTSIYRVDVGGAGSADLFAAEGAVQLNGGTLEVRMGSAPALGSRYTILTGASVAGEFDFDDQMLTAFAGVTDRYTPTSVYLEFAQLRALAEAGQTPNQIVTAAAADALPLLDPVKAAIVLLPDDAAARDAFDQLSGEIHPSARTALIEDSRLPRGAVLGRLSDGAPGGSLWGQAFGNWGDSDGNRNAAPMRRDTWGFVGGADVALGENAVLGVAGAYLDTDLDIRARGSSGSAKTIHALGYAGVRVGGFAIKAGVGYAWADIDTKRSVAFAGFGDALAAVYDGSMLQGFAELGYRVPLGEGQVEPFANITAVRAKTDGFIEIGGEAALSVARMTEKTTVSTMGLRFETAPAAAFSIKGLLGWQHGFGKLDPKGVHAFVGGAPFTILGAAQSRNAGVATIEARFRASAGFDIAVAYDGVLGGQGQDHTVKGTIRLAF